MPIPKPFPINYDYFPENVVADVAKKIPDIMFVSNARHTNTLMLMAISTYLASISMACVHLHPSIMGQFLTSVKCMYI